MTILPSGYVPTSYAVLWRTADQPPCAGELELDDRRLRLEGRCRDGGQTSLEIPYEEIESAFVGRGARERIDGRPTLIVESHGAPRLLVTSAVGLGIIHEMVERLGARIAHEATA
jgi:hypothetical protein